MRGPLRLEQKNLQSMFFIIRYHLKNREVST